MPTPSPEIPTASDWAVVPPSQKASAATATPAGVMAMGAATATATEVAVSVPVLSTSSSPEPASMAAEREFAVAVVSATDKPAGVTATPTDGASDTAVAVMTLSLVMSSCPETVSLAIRPLMVVPVSLVSIRPVTDMSRPSPSPSMPMASAFAVVPPSITASDATATPAVA